MSNQLHMQNGNTNNISMQWSQVGPSVQASSTYSNYHSNKYVYESQSFPQNNSQFSKAQRSPFAARTETEFSLKDAAQVEDKFMHDCLELNREAMLQLNLDADQRCFQLLKQARSTLQLWSSITVEPSYNQNKIWTLTCNNLGCYYKKANKPYAALKHLNTALDLEKYNFQLFAHRSDDVKLEKALAEHASTFLNICAICSSLGKHHEAIQKALMAISCIKRAIRLLRK